MKVSSVRRSVQKHATEQEDGEERVSICDLHSKYSIDPEEFPELRYVGRESYNRVVRHIKNANHPLRKPLVEYGLKAHFEKRGFELNDTRDNKSVMDVEQLYAALSRYGVPRTLNPDKDVLQRAFDIALATFGRRDGEPPLTPYRLEEFDAALSDIRLDKSSGYPHMAKKGDVIELDLEYANQIVERTRSFPPCVAYHRIQHGEEGPKTRLVWGYPLSMTILESLFARPLINKLLRNKDSPSAFGFWKMDIACKMIPIGHMSVRYALDYSKFDATIPARLIDSAFRILRTHFDFNDGEDERIWNQITHYFIHTDIVMPNGKRYRKNRGVPSGSYFTQIVDSIVNFICVQYAMISITGQPVKSEKIMVLGDDSYFGFPKLVPLEAVAGAISELGVIINVSKSEVYTEAESKPYFLGSTWYHGMPHREVDDLVRRMVYPEKYRDLPEQRDRQKMTMYAYLGTCAEAWRLLVDWHRVKTGDCRYYCYDELRVPIDTLNPALRENLIG